MQELYNDRYITLLQQTNIQMNCTLNFITALLWLILSLTVKGQDITGTLTGTVTDQASQTPIAFATVAIVELGLGTTTNERGEFRISEIPVGRHTIRVSFMGYETYVQNGVLLTSGSNAMLHIQLKEKSYSLEEVVLRPREEKEHAINKLATVSAKQLNMEEANRFAGGFDDPARLVSSFAGVSSGVGSNQLVVRGNSPKGILWQIEGVPVPNPNHFAEVTGFGGGGITALSSRTIANSDFFTGAFPAEYGNALASVFDLSIRKGDNSAYSHSFQIGALGIDAASEGPISKKTGASYLFNYRYSTLGLVDELIASTDLGITYQDLSFKLNFPTKKLGTFSLWGLGLKDGTHSTPDADTLNAEGGEGYQWQYYDDLSTEKNNITTGMGGLTHRILLGSRGVLKTNLTGSVSDLFSENSRLDDSFKTDLPLNKIEYTSRDLRLNSVLNYKFGHKHSNRSGIMFTHMNYDFRLQEALNVGDSLTVFAQDQGQSNLIQAFTQSSFSFGRLQINPGIHYLYFSLNGNQSIEPRLAASYRLNDKQSISLGYGLHSQMEKLSFYLSDIPRANGGTEQANKSLDFAKSHHIVLGYDLMLGEQTHFRIEPYAQFLYNVPVIDKSYFSMLNLTDDFFINEQLINTGTGQNIGIDVTLERFMNKGWYYLTTLSLFDSKYTGGDGFERDSRFNRNIISNILIGKEWMIRNKNLFNVSVKYTYLGGNRMHPVNEAASLSARSIVEDLSNPYGIKNPDAHVASLTLSYRINHKKYSSHWSIQILNALAAKEYFGYQYNFREHRIDLNTDAIVVPNISYKIEF